MAKIIDNPKETIISATKDIIETDGIHKLNMRAIAKKCNIALGTIYNYFPTKVDIIIEIIENFWIQCFRQIDLNNIKDKNFFLTLEIIYKLINDHLNNFKINWLDQLSKLSDDDKSKSKGKEKEYINKILFVIEELIDENLHTFNKDRISNLDKHKLAIFIFDNFMIMLRKNKNDYSFFDHILKNILL